jgi:hypothetical protein
MVIGHSIIIDGHKTSVSLEEVYAPTRQGHAAGRGCHRHRPEKRADDSAT